MTPLLCAMYGQLYMEQFPWEEKVPCPICTTEAALRPVQKDIDGMKEIRSSDDLKAFSGRVVAFRRGSPERWMRQVNNPVSFGLVGSGGDSITKLHDDEQKRRKHWWEVSVKTDALWLRLATDQELEVVRETLATGGTWVKKPILAKL